MSGLRAWTPEWDPIPAEELEMQAPRVDPEASIEYLLRRELFDENPGRGRENTVYHRLKIFSEKGVKELDKIDIKHDEDGKVTRFAARIVQPDGTLTAIDRDALHRREVVESEGESSEVQSFALPNLKPGCIVEYQFVLIEAFHYIGLVYFLEAEYPTHRLEFTILPYRGYSSEIRNYNCGVSVEKVNLGYAINLNDLKAYESEPYSPPIRVYRPWIYLRPVYDRADLKEDADKYWERRVKTLRERNEEFITPKDRRVRKLAAELFDGISDPEERLEKAYSYCTENIKNIYAPASGYTDEEIEELPETDKPADVIKRGHGSSWDINCLFASLAIAAGFEAQLSDVENRLVMPFSKTTKGDINLRDRIVAVGCDGNWRTFCPGGLYTPYGWLVSAHSGSVFLVEESKKPVFQKTETRAPTDSRVIRMAEATIDEEGNLTAEVKISYTGYSGMWRKYVYDGMTDSEREESVLEDFQDRIPRAEFEDFHMEHVTDRNDDLHVGFTLNIPGYADVLGSRMFFDVNFFERGEKPVFSDETRNQIIFSNTQWVANDRIRFNLPVGYQPEEASSPGQIIDTVVLKFAATLDVNASGDLLVYNRLLENKITALETSVYPTLKAIFDEINRQDHHSVGIKKSSDG